MPSLPHVPDYVTLPTGLQEHSTVTRSTIFYVCAAIKPKTWDETIPFQPQFGSVVKTDDNQSHHEKECEKDLPLTE